MMADEFVVFVAFVVLILLVDELDEADRDEAEIDADTDRIREESD